MNNRPWYVHYDREVPAHMEYPQITVQEMFKDSAKRYSNLPCTIFKGAIITYAEMDL